MANKLNSAVDFGPGYADLPVGYQLFNADSTPNGLRVTSGIFQSNPGTYHKLITFPDYFIGEIRWDTGGSNPVFASSFIDPGTITTATVVTNNYPTDVLPPLSGFQASTTFNPTIKSYEAVRDRIFRACGAPAVGVEVCDEQVYDFINQGIEWYTKYAGFTTEYLVFSSDLYVHGLGIKLDALFSITPEMNVTTIDQVTQTMTLSGSYDYDLGSYRKVVDVFSFSQGENTGINTLFTLEQGMAQQVYSTFLLGNVGFDLVTWHALKDWLDIREKVLAQTPYFRFDPRTQTLRVIPEPGTASTSFGSTPYYGLVGCTVERPIKDVITERWVYRYALALTKIALGHIRGKFQGTTLFGGGTINGNDLMSQGLAEQEKLETELTAGFGEAEPANFYIG